MARTARDALWASGHDESVEVNQRALIDKVLARYSGEFTVFRELLQNSDDAQATAVEIRFETKTFLDRKQGLLSEDVPLEQSLPDLKSAVVHQWSFMNNGIVFRDEDWNRLKKIAEGNPDEEKIGAFGVGFYSLFSVTEEPFVTSGGQWMGFYWKDKKDQLFARRGQLPPEKAASPWTTFDMVLREAAPIPVAFDFTRFLASSITFMTYLADVSLFFDDKCLARIKKTAGVPKELGIPKGLHNTSSSGMVTIRNIRSTPLHIQAHVMHWVYASGSEKKSRQPLTVKQKTGGFFSSWFTSVAAAATPRSSTPLPLASINSVDPLAVNETNVSLSIFCADVDVHLNKKIATELHRSTKKNPPNHLKYELIYTAKDEYDASKKEDERHTFVTGSIFQGLRADLDGGGARIFIGHATSQTTGLGGHMSSRFIPTVERESIDLMDRNVAVWNKELLYVGGFLARTAYELELNTVKSLWDGAAPVGSSLNSPDLQLQLWLRSRSIHALRFFTFHPSTPSTDISSILEAAFFSCAEGNYFPLISTVGVRNISEIRLPDPAFSGFLKDLPVLPDNVLPSASAMIASLQNRGMIKNITFDDVLKNLRSRPLGEAEMIACLKWWISLNKDSVNLQLGPREQLLDAAVLVLGEPGSGDEKIIPLTSLRTFINTRTIANIIPLEGPLPDHLLPHTISKHFTSDDLTSSYPWTELTIPEWVGYICSNAARKANVEYDLTLSATWSERVLSVVARAWPSLSASAKTEVHGHLKTLTCVPTSGGMKSPEQSYFVQANIFHDLPVVAFPSGTTPKGNMERVLQALGVRRHVELQIVFNRMIKTNEWTVADLAKYLVSVQSTLSNEEWARLKVTAAFFKETTPGGDAGSQKPMRYQAQELYEPLDVFRQLGLPVMDWGKQKWRSSSDEAKFLFDLGLLRYPSLLVLVNLCASTDSDVRRHALAYLLSNIGTHYKHYDPSKFNNVAFIPAIQSSRSSLQAPKDVFSSPDSATLGFWVIDPNLPSDAATKLKIMQHPPTSRIVNFLQEHPPKDEVEAKSWFSILASRISGFSSEELQRLSQCKMVPVRDKNDGKVRWHPPAHCYFAGEAKGQFRSKLFVFVDFGQPANGFLTACGTKHEPSVEEVALTLLDDPRKFYAFAEGPTQYLDELRNIAVNYRLLKTATFNRMKQSPVLLGTQRKPRESNVNSDLDDPDEDDVELRYDLREAKEIVIADETHAHKAFGDSIFTAPQEDILEGFYGILGSRRLSSLVVEEYQSTSEIKESKAAADTRNLILERLPLFLHEHGHARTLVSYSSLTSPANFSVKTFGKISVTKSLAIGGRRLSHKQDASAVAQRFGRNGAIQLWIAGNAQIDMYEVATSLNRLIFESPKANDALLFMTILSTDLKALKRRGYNVDRILRQQHAQQQASEAAKKSEQQALSSSPSPSLSPNPVDSQNVPPSQITKPARPVPPNPTRNPLMRLIGKPDSSSPPEPSIPVPRVPLKQASESRSNTGSGVTPVKDIRSNIETAIKACRPESGNLLRNREEMRQVKESLNEGYCDVSGRVGDLRRIGEMGRIKVYLSHDVPAQKDFMATHHDLLARFIHILLKLSGVYDLPLTNLHIFYDLGGGLIAFNRNGSIFLNLRYYKDWHDSEVLMGRLSSAYISWYFTLAHEIAHNLVQPHNSEHEFYFSAICEKYLMDMKPLLASS